MNKLWVGETKVFNWLFSWPLNCQFGDMESSKKLESYVCVLSSDSKTSLICGINYANFIEL